ncbi:hypothetical protein PHJA_002881200, partial [Phtheirospermum japonicum]
SQTWRRCIDCLLSIDLLCSKYIFRRRCIDCLDGNIKSQSEHHRLVRSSPPPLKSAPTFQ